MTEQQQKGPESRPARKSDKMGTMPIPKLLLSMSWPAMISMLVHSLYNIVDSMFVAHISEQSLSALTYAFPAQQLLIAVTIGTAVGTNSLIARRLGARRHEEADLAASMGIRLMIISWLFFAVAGIFLSGPFIRIFSEDPYIISQGKIYLTIVLVFSIFSMIQVMLERCLQASGNMIYPMIASLISTVVNIALDPILIFGFFGLPAMGVKGAAIATVAGQAVGMVAVYYCLVRFNDEIHVHLKAKWDSATVREIYRVGLPSIILQTVVSFTNFCMNFILSGFSDTAVAVMGAYNRLQSFVFMPLFGLNQGSTPIFGYNYGARNKKRLMEALKVAWIISVSVMTLGVILFQTIPGQLLLLFDASENMLAIGIPAMRIVSICFLPAAIGIISGGLFAATGHGTISLASSLIRQLVFVIPLAFLLAKLGGLAAVWWAYPLAEIFGLCYTLFMVRWVYKKDISRLEDPIVG